jgi:hypothetical protein
MRPGVTLLLSSRSLLGVLLLVSVSGIVTVELAGFVHHGHYYEGGNFLFQQEWEPGLCDGRGDTGCLCGL